jgi:PKD repeat protein
MDGDLDILGAQTGIEMNSEPAFLFRNDGSCNFSNQSSSNIKGGYSGYASWMDYDNDSYPDILSTGILKDYAFSSLYRNNQNGSFTEFSDANISGVANGSSDYGDIDNDGDPDFLLTGRINIHGMERTGAFYQNNIYMNAGPYPANRRPEAPLNPKTAVQSGGIQLKWDAVKSDETPEKAMSYNFRYKNVDSTTWLGTPMSSETGVRRIAGPGNLHQNASVILNLLEGSYIWQVQAIDGGYIASPWSETNTFKTKSTQAFFKADTVCRGTATQFTDKSFSTDEIVSWEWNFGDASAISNLKNPTHLFESSGLHNVKLIIKNSKEVSDTIYANVKVKNSPYVVFVADDVCEGTTASIDNQTTNGGTVITGWNWNFGDGQTSTLEEPQNHVYSAQNTYLLKLSVTADNGCDASMSRNLTVATKPNATLSLEYGVPSFCLGDSVIYSALSNSNCNYHWLRDNEYISETTNVLKVKTISGDYMLEITNKTTNACSSTSVVKTISVKYAPSVPTIAEVNNNTLFCEGTQVELVVTNPNSDYTYQWKRSGVAIEDANQASYQGRLPEGDYTVVAGTGNCGTTSETLILKNKPGPEKPKIFARGPNVWLLICDNTTATEYKWYYNNELIPGAKISQYVARQNLGEYYVEVNEGGECTTPSDVITIPTANSGNGKAGIADETITLYPNPAESKVNVKLENLLPGNVDVELTNSLGYIVARYQFENSAGFDMDLSEMPAGVYFCKIFYEDGVVIKKIMKQ